MRFAQLARLTLALSITGLGVSACGSPGAPPKAVAPVAIAGKVEISEPRVRLPASGQTQTAAYLTLTNTGSQSERLVSATSTDAKKLELHAHTKTADGMMMMRQLDFIDVPQGTTIPLVPGGLHIMVKQVKPDLKVGDVINMELTFASGMAANFNLPVVANPRAQTEGDPANKQNHQH